MQRFSLGEQKKIFDFIEKCWNGELSGRSRLPDKGLKYEKVFLSVFQNGKVRACQSGKAAKNSRGRLASDLKMALESCLADYRFGKCVTRKELPECDLVLEFFFSKSRLPVIRNGKKIEVKQGQFQAGEDALQVVNGRKTAFYKAAVLIEGNFTVDQALPKLVKKAGLPREALADPKTVFYKYKSYCLARMKDGRLSELKKLNPWPGKEQPDLEDVQESLELAGNWMKKNINASGLPEYAYLPSKRKHLPKVNHLRILGAAWGDQHLQEYSGDKTLGKIAEKVIEHYLDKYLVKKDGNLFLKIHGSAKISFNAFMILILLRGKKTAKREKILAGLVKALLSREHQNGGFFTDFERNIRTGSDFYTGESLLALIQYFQQYPGQADQKIILKAFDYYRNYWRKKPSTAFIPWHTQVYFQAYHWLKDEQMKKFIFEMNDWLVKQQILKGSPDEQGGFGSQAMINTSSYLEGLLDAWKLAVEMGEEKRVARYHRAILLAFRFLLRLQYTPENTFYLRRAAQAIGGFRQSLTDNLQRCDTVQHASMALIKSIRYGFWKKAKLAKREKINFEIPITAAVN